MNAAEDMAIKASKLESETYGLISSSHSSPEDSEGESSSELKRRSASTGALAALSCMILSECLSETIVYPFAPFMISHFRVTDEPTKIG